MLLESGYILSWSAKWLGHNSQGSDTIFFSSLATASPKKMLKEMHALLDEADAIITYNGIKHDIPILNREFLVNELAPPSPYKHIDLYQVVKKVFKFPSNKLEYVCRALGVGQKIKHIGYELWLRCMKSTKDREAWKMMMDYNINDVKILEEVYMKLLPWIRGHANYGIYQDDKLVCPNCGSTHYQSRGYAYTHTNKYQRFQCQGCRKWFRDNKALSIPGKKFVDIS